MTFNGVTFLEVPKIGMNTIYDDETLDTMKEMEIIIELLESWYKSLKDINSQEMKVSIKTNTCERACLLPSSNF
jgi:hypothetical protein